MRKFFNDNFWWIVCCAIFCLAGFVAGRIIKDIPYLTLDTKVGIGDIANFIIALVVAVLIPIFLSPIITNKRAIKDFLIDEVQDAIEFLVSIKADVDDMAVRNSAEETDRIKINSMIAQDLGMKIGSLGDQLEASFKHRSRRLKPELTERYNEYWREMTGGELMSRTFQFTIAFRNTHDRHYARLLASLKKAIHEINNF